MARISHIEQGRGLLDRIVFFMCKRQFGRVLTPLKIKAHHPRLLRGYVHMELGQDAAKAVDAKLKALAQLKVARVIACPF